jgi:hypothetical protein
MKMMTKIAANLFFVLCSLSYCLSETVIYEGEIRLVEHDIVSVITSSQPSEYTADAELPASWDWRPLGMLTADLNQHIPQ